jgi:uncharacterized membrane protein
MYKSLLATHITAGSVALASMWIPMIARKGGQAHRRAGWVFVAAMALVSVTALLMSGWLFFGPQPERGVFLLDLAVFTACTVSSGVRVLQGRGRWSDIGLPVSLTLLSLGTGCYGLSIGEGKLVAISLMGFISGVADLRYWLRPPAMPMRHVFKHMGGMLTSCIAAWGAFTSNFTNLRIWPGAAVALSVVGVVGFSGRVIWMRYYRREFSNRNSPVRPDMIASATSFPRSPISPTGPTHAGQPASHPQPSISSRV